jgi:lipoprotein-releasing system ATP-binding protein
MDWAHVPSCLPDRPRIFPPERFMSLQVRDLCKDYPTRTGQLSILRQVSMDLQKGEALAVMGPSGSGKSTLLHVLGTLDRPTSGTVLLQGKDPFALSEKQLADFRNRHIGFVFQDHHLLPQCSVLENVLIPTLVAADSKAEMEMWARELLHRVGLSDRLDHRPAELSGGERQRAAVARALIHKPTLLLADEPTGNLDRRTAHTIGHLLLDLHRQEQNVLVVVTHSAELAQLLPRRAEMADGALRPPHMTGATGMAGNEQPAQLPRVQAAKPVPPDAPPVEGRA